MQSSLKTKRIAIGVVGKVITCLLTFLSGLIFLYTDSALIKFLSISIFALTAEFMIILWVAYYTEGLINSVDYIINKNNKIEWRINPELVDLAKRMNVRLHKSKPFGMAKGLDNACANLMTKQVVFGDKLLEKLNKNEGLAVAAHEFTHIIRRVSRSIISLWLISFMVIFLSLVNGPDIVKWLIVFAAFNVSFVFTNWKDEYDADFGAAKVVGAPMVISTLQKLRPEAERSVKTVTHPSIECRIRKLINKFPSHG